MHFADGTAHKNRMQGNDFVQSLMYRRGVTCFSCTSSRNRQQCRSDQTGRPALPELPRTVVSEWSARRNDRSPHPPSRRQHRQRLRVMPHAEDRATIADINVRSHTFNFITPEMTDQYKIPNSCNTCHTDKTTDWARQAMKDWTNVSPWRVN